MVKLISIKWLLSVDHTFRERYSCKIIFFDLEIGLVSLLLVFLSSEILS